MSEPPVFRPFDEMTDEEIQAEIEELSKKTCLLGSIVR